jgi:signal transduction histidine kinase
MTHELKTPLATVSAAVEGMLSFRGPARPAENPAIPEYLQERIAAAI